MSWDLVTAWAHMPIFHVKVYSDHATYMLHDRAYAEQIFPDGEDLVSAIQWWRKRMSQAGKGCAVFEGGFDLAGRVHLTDAPILCIDAESGEAAGDTDSAISTKRGKHIKRQEMERMWREKGVSDDLRQKIRNAEAMIREKKRRGQEYMLQAGWVSPREVSKDIVRHNEIRVMTARRLEGY